VSCSSNAEVDRELHRVYLIIPIALKPKYPTPEHFKKLLDGMEREKIVVEIAERDVMR